MAETKTCSVDGCEKTVQCKGYCPMHYQRQRIHGDIGSARAARRSHKGKKCSIRSCDRPRRKDIYCGRHYAHWRRTGRATAPLHHEWAEPTEACLYCGAPAIELRSFCSDVCRLHYRNGRPKAVPCAVCEWPIDLVSARPGRKRTNCTIRVCRRCRQDWRKHGFSVNTLINRDGSRCGLCAELVDVSLHAPDPLCASVDHVVPRSLGGTNDPSNLQLAHLGCNVRKGATITEKVVA